MINICIFNGDMSRGGGTERITQLLANALSKEPGYHITILNLNNEKGTSFFPIDEGIDFEILEPGGVIQKNLAVLRFVRKHRIDVLINVDVMLGIFSLPVTYLHRKTKLISWEMFNLRNDIGTKNTLRVRKLCLRRSAYYVNQTKGDMEAFQREMKVKCPITYIYNPCDPNLGYDDYDRESKTIVTAGHFFYAKGYDLAVRTAKIVFEKHPDWKWEFYGDGSQMNKIIGATVKLGLADNVIFCGRTSHIEEAYKHAAMYVMTSRTEGFGLVLTEAKAYNLPTLSFDIDFGPREIIENDVSGYLVPAFDVAQMADRICELIEDPEKRCRFSRQAKANLDKFSQDAFVDRWKKVIDELIND